MGIGIAIFFIWSFLAPLYNQLKPEIKVVTRWFKENTRPRQRKSIKKPVKRGVEEEKPPESFEEEKPPKEEFNPIIRRWLEQVRHVGADDR